ncbi:asparaginase-domain-containing protein [Hygrophoropsis aurantiaca]|uniref:Asparaginase-domain-containing protein n=1 Tax=Hygrophoropsis aurantiaca TaxID=72124 RepID=A0ACB8A5U6_9AGAM|nr:asparaginase-domain-containing protein [Hygrophoropsis aurantiaca]
MLVSAQGYVPEPYFLTETLRSQHRFHDPLQDSLFSNAGSVEGYRVWSTNGRASPNAPGGTTVNATPSGAVSSQSHQPTLGVRSSRPIGLSSPLTPNTEQKISGERIECKHISEAIYEAHLPTLVTPRSIVPGQSNSKRIRYAILEWNPLLDSSNIEIDDWIRIATEIELNYANFDAFVILHGTDTMSYSAGALSFLLEDLGKTVILTGAQIPLFQLRNDAVDNLLGALSIAGNYIIPECSLYFNHTLFRGNRVSKASSYDLDAFHSPNFPALVNVGIDIVVNWNDVIRQTSLRRFKAHKEMSPHVATLRLFPGITGATIRAFLMPPTRGVVLETFGAGNAPQRTDLMTALKEACDRGIVIVAITQCSKGSVSDAYETGRTLLQAGVVPGGDMTPECALAKLGYLLSKPELTVGQVRELMGTPLRGELTRRAVPAVNQPDSETDLPNIQGLLSQFVRLADTSSHTPRIVLAPSIGDIADRAAAPWSRTVAETASTEAALLPFLIHLASARDDMESMQYCLSAFSRDDRDDRSALAIPGGIVNCIEPGSGRSPLHVAALNGSIRCLSCLLQSGALVHLRDSLGHTALYYATRQGHEEIVDLLISAGANLGGVESETGFVTLAMQNALRSGNEKAFRLWAKTGIFKSNNTDTKPT